MIKIGDMLLEELGRDLPGEIADPVAALRGRAGQVLEVMTPRRTFTDGSRGYHAIAQTTIEVVVGKDPYDASAPRERFEFPEAPCHIQLHDPVLTLNGALRLDLEIKQYRTEATSRVLFPGEKVALGIGRSFDVSLPPSLGRLEIPLGTDFAAGDTVRSHQMIYLAVETPIGTLHNPDAAHMFATINKVPPVGFSYLQEGLVPMANANKEVVAIKVFTETALHSVITAD
ncbi:hypothetical protein E1193_01280 [Micromonospora sp. KC606]|uniref:hypothetical protein n=1 Tax=Micromonospora sp. KC606 TaxID=2530379 RepID=UPI0010484057|nr:hypothetical protein [Micromonospora sp. KC606]TDC85964.1 hypothetical protein E1193_01280 [Micromonospora sp. KC606]